MGAIARHKPVSVCFPFVGDLIGGSHFSARDLIRGLDRNRFIPLVLVQKSDGALAQFFAEAGIATEAAPASAELRHGVPIGPSHVIALGGRVLALARFLRQRGVRIVHSNDGRTHATWALPARMAGAKLLWHHRGAPDAAGLRYLAPLLANRVVAVSRFASPRAGLYSAAPRNDVVHSPFDTSMRYNRSEARDAILADIGKDDTTCLVGFSGVFIDRKRPFLFVDAIAALRREAPDLDVHGLMFGEGLEGMDEQVVAHAGRQGVGDAIHIMGFRTPGAFWLAGCDILMIPAVDEPFGRTLIEAMLVETPVVATKSGGNVEAIHDRSTGLLVPAEDADALASACVTLLRNPSTAALIAHTARIEALNNFGVSRHVRAIMAIYDRMVDSEHSRAA
jgi:glycosyltransferase involved in cell wall biosynthesis|tara:strand:+ start:834 stop:2012 length:1179 start_codon:yes stop_codon:yes gene_type:complete